MKSAEEILELWDRYIATTPIEKMPLQFLILVDEVRQEARREALEEAETVVDKIANKYRKIHHSEYENIADECSGEIRALINQYQKKGEG